ncbi:hypothetical protein PSAB6_30409 [Paraburkholderia sabiae]|nr:hypothetical protein PSAB6_30409 [Paraburkholderia sabiae]
MLGVIPQRRSGKVRKRGKECQPSKAKLSGRNFDVFPSLPDCCFEQSALSSTRGNGYLTRVLLCHSIGESDSFIALPKKAAILE